MAGTDEVTTEYESKNELDFNNRLIAKFRLTGGKNFWRGGFRVFPRKSLCPENDQVQDICDKLRRDVDTGATPGRIGAFLKDWTEVEADTVSLA